jgi:hypothetical protein
MNLSVYIIWTQRAMEEQSFSRCNNKISRACDGQACSYRPRRTKVLETRITDRHLAGGEKYTCLYSKIYHTM